jgi:hypothetical protein
MSGRIAFYQREDRLAPVTVIVPNHYVGLWLRRELAQTGYANVRFDVLARLGERIGAGLLAKRGLSPLTSVAEDAAIRCAIATVAEQFGAAAQHAALVDTLCDLFRSLREREVDAETLASWRDASRMSGAALSAFAEYERLLERHRLYDDRVGLDAATERASALLADALRDAGAVLVYLPTRPSPAAARIAAVGPRRRALSTPRVDSSICVARWTITSEPGVRSKRFKGRDHETTREDGVLTAQVPRPGSVGNREDRTPMTRIKIAHPGVNVVGHCPTGPICNDSCKPRMILDPQRIQVKLRALM